MSTKLSLGSEVSEIGWNPTFPARRVIPSQTWVVSFERSSLQRDLRACGEGAAIWVACQSTLEHTLYPCISAALSGSAGQPDSTMPSRLDGLSVGNRAAQRTKALGPH